LRVVCNAALERDRLVLRPPGGFPAAAVVATLPVPHHLGRPLQGAHLADARDVPAFPFHPELEVLVGVEAIRIDRELRHAAPPLRRDLAGDLLELDDDELRGLERRETD